MLVPQPLRLVNEGPLYAFGKQLPFGTKEFGDLGIVQPRVGCRYVFSSDPGPDHERVHGTFDVFSHRTGTGRDAVVGDVDDVRWDGTNGWSVGLRN